MKYGLPELPEEKDIPEIYRKMLKAGIAWGCTYLNGFLESILRNTRICLETRDGVISIDDDKTPCFAVI